MTLEKAWKDANLGLAKADLVKAIASATTSQASLAKPTESEVPGGRQHLPGANRPHA
jgi:hypothetical protein